MTSSAKTFQNETFDTTYTIPYEKCIRFSENIYTISVK